MERKKILIVEDEAALSRVLGLKLASAGFECDTAFDGHEANKKITYNIYDLILLDLIIPGMNGFEILEKIQNFKSKPKVFVLSNLSQENDIKRAKDLGAIDFFIKSDIQLAEIVNHIKKILS